MTPKICSAEKYYTTEPGRQKDLVLRNLRVVRGSSGTDIRGVGGGARVVRLNFRVSFQIQKIVQVGCQMDFASTAGSKAVTI